MLSKVSTVKEIFIFDFLQDSFKKWINAKDFCTLIRNALVNIVASATAREFLVGR